MTTVDLYTTLERSVVIFDIMKMLVYVAGVLPALLPLILQEKVAVGPYRREVLGRYNIGMQIVNSDPASSLRKSDYFITIFLVPNRTSTC